MTALPLTIGTIHFIGIGGIGMSGIAEILFSLGYQVQGSDITENNNVKRLRKLGIQISTPQDASNINKVAFVIVSTAIKPDNIELEEAKRQFLPIVHRAEMLGELMRLRWSIAIAGTHGKTTTTSLVATILETAGYDPTVVNGGIIQGWGSNARLGLGDWMVVEADESDGSFSKLNPTVAVVTNIDPEHLDYHGSYENLERAFANFVGTIPFYGFASVCIDHPSVQRLLPTIMDRRIITFGLASNADVRASNVHSKDRKMVFDLQLSDRIAGFEKQTATLHFPMLGEHNIQNCLAAISVCLEMGINITTIEKALADFNGVARRFDYKGCEAGITIIDDYGHHPVEIKAALSAARLYCGTGKVIAVVQPHRYSRVRDLFSDFCACFNNADIIIVADIYAAGEAPLQGYEKEDLVRGLHEFGHRNAMILDHQDNLAHMIYEYGHAGDLVVCLGAGTITSWAAALPEQIAQIAPQKKQESVL